MSMRDDIVAVAVSQLGNNGDKYNDFMGVGRDTAWCAAFVCWCANEIGVLGNCIPRINSCSTNVDWYENKGWARDKNYKPQPGDIVYFDWDDVGYALPGEGGKAYEHTGIVEKFDGSTVYTIEGNTSNGLVARNRYAHGGAYIWRYASPQYPDGKNADGTVSVSTDESERRLLSKPTISYSDNTEEATEFLLKLNEIEKRYGVLVHSVTQPMIKFENADATKTDMNEYCNNFIYGTSGIKMTASDKAYEALEAYAKFYLNYLNSESNTASATCLPMPWLRPGTNVWVDPDGFDRIYYLNTVTHSGSAEAGCRTTLSMTVGRKRENFLSGATAFGARKDSTEDIFINEIIKDISTYGKVISDYNQVQEDIKKFHQSVSTKEIKMATDEASPLKRYYTNEDHDVKRVHCWMDVTDVKTGDRGFTKEVRDEFIKFDGEYSVGEIQKALSQAYDNAPEVVKKRRSRLKKIIENSSKRLGMYYVDE